MASRISAPITSGIESRMVRSIWVAGPEIASILSASRAEIVTGIMIRKKTTIPIDLLIDVRLRRRSAGRPAGRRRSGAGGFREPGLAEPSVRIGGEQRAFDQPPDDPGDDQADEEDQPRADHVRNEGEGVGGELAHRIEHSAELERLHGEHDSDEDDQPEDDVADQAAERLARLRLIMLPQRRHPVDHLGDRPFGGPGEQPGDDEDGDGGQYPRPPEHELGLPVIAVSGIVAVHALSPLVEAAARRSHCDNGGRPQGFRSAQGGEHVPDEGRRDRRRCRGRHSRGGR